MTLSSQPRILPLPAGEIGLLTDLYELTMAQSYFAEGISGEGHVQPLRARVPAGPRLPGRRRHRRRPGLSGSAVLR